jgi:hypothetical protein
MTSCATESAWIFRLSVRPDLSQLDAIAARVEAHFALLGGAS